MKKFVNKLMSKRFVAGIAAATMAVTMTATAFAATTSPNMTNHYATPYTTVVQAGQRATLMAVPADENWVGNTFDSIADAGTQAVDNDAKYVTWAAYAGNTDNISRIAWAGANTTDQNGNAVIASRATVTVASDAEVGPATVRVTNESVSTKPTMDFTVVVDSNTEPAKSNLTYIIDPNDSTNTPVTVAVASVTGEEHNTGENTHYPSAIDGIVAADTANTAISNVQIGDPSGSGSNMVTTMTVNGKEYARNTSTWEGWYYCVYRTNESGQKVKVPGCDVYGAEEFALQSGDTVMWKYGAWGVTFPDTIA